MDGSHGRLPVRRFPNAPRQFGGHWFWDPEYLWEEYFGAWRCR
jgi:hypothetical protein